MADNTFILHPGKLHLAELRRLYRESLQIDLEETAWEQIERSRNTIIEIINTGSVAYGVNTGFGLLANTRIKTGQLQQLQRNLLLSHAAGVGELLSDDLVRLILVMKINTLARGFSGVRVEVIRLLLGLLKHGIYPCIPAKGSVGASGDLAPLAHLALALIGEGKVRVKGNCLASHKALHKAGLEPLTLQAKEGLALINGTQVSTALALQGLFEAECNLNAAFVAGAMTVEAVLGSHDPFDARIHELRGQSGQIEAARIYREMLTPSEIQHSHMDCEKVQDPYSLRCQPQVMGACLDQARFTAARLEVEANAVTDNPLVFSDPGDVLSGGNFHAEPVAMAADNLALAIAETGALSERRMAMLIDASLSQLPPFLVTKPGLNSGFMITHVTAAALASENKSLAHPACVDSLPTSANQEDHVSMAAFAARRLAEMNLNTRYILAVELLAAAQGIDLRRPLKSNVCIEENHALIRTVARCMDEDRYFQPDLEAVAALIANARFSNRVQAYIESTP